MAKIFSPDEWMVEKIEGKENLYRAVLCLEHLIMSNYDGKPINVVEVGPISSIGLEDHIAPISTLYERNPHLNCLSIGAIDASEEQIRKTLGNVEYLRGLLIPGKDDSAKLLEKLEGNPDIIYGQHVFESSPATPTSLPFGYAKPFEKSAEILKDGGFIVVDNYGGKMNVGIQSHWPNSSKMAHVMSYMYSNNEGIYVFQKLLTKSI